VGDGVEGAQLPKNNRPTDHNRQPTCVRTLSLGNAALRYEVSTSSSSSSSSSYYYYYYYSYSYSYYYSYYYSYSSLRKGRLGRLVG
jgi:hypothetical protein